MAVRSSHLASKAHLSLTEDGTGLLLYEVMLDGRTVDAPKTWWEAQMLHKGEERGEWTEEEREEWRPGLVKKADRQFGAALADLMSRSPEAAAELLEQRGGRLLSDVLEHLGYVREEDEEELEDFPFQFPQGRIVQGGAFLRGNQCVAVIEFTPIGWEKQWEREERGSGRPGYSGRSG